MIFIFNIYVCEFQYVKISHHIIHMCDFLVFQNFNFHIHVYEFPV